MTNDLIMITHNPADTKIALLAGGTSSEREISLKSAEGAREALEEAGYPVTTLDTADASALKRLTSDEFDFAFIAVHGEGGENGALQGFLETVGLPYTGSGIAASAICMDKSKAKLFYEHAGIPTPEAIVLKKEQYANLGEIPEEATEEAVEEIADEARSVSVSSTMAQPVSMQPSSGLVTPVTSAAILERLGGKAVVKVPTEGSSIGVYIVDNSNDMDAALDEAFTMCNEVLIERFVAGREFTCVVFGSGDAAHAFPVIEIVPKNASYDFESKYAPGGSEHICPAKISPETTALIQKYAVAAQNAVGCDGAARTDFLLDDNGTPWALETNTVPGMTATSLLPDAARAINISFPELCMMMVQSGLNAVAERAECSERAECAEI